MNHFQKRGYSGYRVNTVTWKERIEALGWAQHNSIYK
jgi:hypothetical protein